MGAARILNCAVQVTQETVDDVHAIFTIGGVGAQTLRSLFLVRGMNPSELNSDNVFTYDTRHPVPDSNSKGFQFILESLKNAAAEKEIA